MSDDTPRAVLDVGSNTVRLLVARLLDGNLQPLLDQSEFVRLGLGVDKSGRLQADREEAAIGAINRLVDLARREGAPSVFGIATSAVRDASNGEEFVRTVRDKTGVEVTIISGEREAELTFRGATLGLSVSGGAIVCDLGGGSAELIHADASGILWARSEKLGSGRLTERFVQHDPPRSEELAAVAGHVQGVLAGLPAAHAQLAAFTGGTASHVAWLAGLTDTVASIDLEGIRRVVRTLSLLPAADVVSRYNVQEERARVLPAGATAVQTIAEYYNVDRIVITRRGIREGAVLEAAEQS